MIEDIRMRDVPDEQIEITLGLYIPLIMTAQTYCGKSSWEVIKLAKELTCIAYELVDKHGYDLPLATGKFVQDAEAEEEYLLKVPGRSGCSMRVVVQLHAPHYSPQARILSIE